MIKLTKDGLPKSLAKSKWKLVHKTTNNQKTSILLDYDEIIEAYYELGKYITQLKRCVTFMFRSLLCKRFIQTFK